MKLTRITCATVLAAVSLIFGGCASASKPSAMTANFSAPITQNTGSVAVNVSGGSETSSMGASKIANADFSQAVQDSITQSGLFAKIAPRSASEYNLDVQIVRLDQPMFGASFTVTLECTWRLARQNDGGVIWEKAITTPFTASMGDSLSGVTRLRLANEGAARANIQQALTEMSALRLQ